ncbi:helix-turn-helix transcriptional regulator [Pedobacter frigiditerrae]|uniref:helix-turn-helix transcriptional regulator n=1 Tax=Pedobacter frigiditerrae TaxID=2530452 RepID=UPI00292D2141|nr:helix-turn-helix transcriptional regulator [Pedobacter frigiditerrae]
MKKATGKVIKTFRKHLGYTQEFLATEINVTTRTIENIENGKVSVDVEKIHKIAKLFKIRSGLILELAAEIVDTEDNMALETAVKQLRPVYTKEDLEGMN